MQTIIQTEWRESARVVGAHQVGVRGQVARAAYVAARRSKALGVFGGARPLHAAGGGGGGGCAQGTAATA